MWLEEWDQLLRVVAIGLPVYLVMVVLLRVFGVRALSKMNAFDTIVSFALGSALAAAVLTQQLPGALALASIILLLVLQFVLSWLAVRVPAISRLTTATPKLLLLEGNFRDEDMRAARISRAAVRAAVRAQGIARVEDVFAVVLETDGALSVLRHQGEVWPSAMEGVAGMPQRGQE